MGNSIDKYVLFSISQSHLDPVTHYLLMRVDRFFARLIQPSEHPCTLAVRTGDVAGLQLLFTYNELLKSGKWIETACVEAIKHGHLDMLRYLDAHCEQVLTIHQQMKCGYLDPYGRYDPLLMIAAEHNHLVNTDQQSTVVELVSRGM
jgi:hypothetical protein